MRAWLAGGISCAVAACAAGGTECDEALRLCDIGSAECRTHVFAQTACARGFDGDEGPPVHTISRADFVELLRLDLPATDAERLADEQRATAMRMVRMTPPGTTSEQEASIEALATGVLAFYDRESRSVTIVEDNLGNAERSAEIFVLSHEFVHAQQDIDVDLEAVFDEHATTYDASIALRCVTEGEAVHYSNLTIVRQQRGATVSAAEFAGYYTEQQGAIWALAEDREAVGHNELGLSFPYPFGGELVTSTWMDRGDGAVLALYDDPWASTGDVLRLLEGEGTRRVPEIAVAAPTLPEGWSIVADDTFGAFMTYAFAHRNLVARSTAKELAHDWTGDRILVAAGPGANDVALVWAFRFGSPAHAEILATIADLPPHEGAWSVTVDAGNVVFVVAPDAASLPSWEATFVPAVAAPPLGLRAHAGVARLAPPLRRPADIRRHPGVGMPHAAAMTRNGEGARSDRRAGT